MTTRTVALLAFTGAVLLLVFIMGHHRGRRSRRNEYPDGWDAGQKAERDWWEHATGATRDALARWQTRQQPEDGPEPEWPYGFRVDPVLPATEVLLAEADTVLGRPPRAPGVPTVAEVDEMAAAYEAAHAGVDSHVRTGASAPGWPGAGPQPGDFSSHPSPAEPGPPVVADITSAAKWRPFEDETPTITGVIHPPGTAPDGGECHGECHHCAGDWDRLAGRVLPEYAAAALGGHRSVDDCVDSIVMRAVTP